MNGLNVDIYTIIFLALAVFIVLRLRSVLGQRTGRERPPYDISAARDAARVNDNVVALPGRTAEATPNAPADPSIPTTDRWKEFAEPGSALARGFEAVAEKDPSFEPRGFLGGAKGAYEMIVTAFAQGDRRTLKDLLSPEVYEGFDAAIREREQRGETAETRFVGIDKAAIVGAELRNRTAQITVKFSSQIVSVTRDKAGTVVDGNADKVTDVNDVWTFARDVSSRDPNWKLVATESGQ
jgi:predicted lipid-binding transport protein (Tim44 family)